MWHFMHSAKKYSAYLIKRKIITMTGLGLSQIIKINSQQEKPISPNCKICMKDELQGLRPYYLLNPCKNFLIGLASKAPYSQLFTSNS